MDLPKETKKSTPTPEVGKKTSSSHRQLPSLLLFLGAIILLNLCPFQSFRFEPVYESHVDEQRNTLLPNSQYQEAKSIDFSSQLNGLEACIKFVRLMFTNPLRLERRITSFSVADAKVIGKMVKVLYIKKKIKKLGKKLKKHTIAVPVFTAIPIYEHPYFPQPPIAHLPPAAAAAAIHHAAAASSLMPTMAQLTTTMNPLMVNQVGTASAMNAAASNTHQQVTPYRLPHQNTHHPAPLVQAQAAGMFHPSHLAAAQQIINHYAPSPPIFVDETGGLYGTYGNAYGRYDGGYHVW